MRLFRKFNFLIYRDGNLTRIMEIIYYLDVSFASKRCTNCKNVNSRLQLNYNSSRRLIYKLAAVIFSNRDAG